MEKNQPYKQDKVFDNILETEEFNVYTKIDDLPLDENPMYPFFKIHRIFIKR